MAHSWIDDVSDASRSLRAGRELLRKTARRSAPTRKTPIHDAGRLQDTAEHQAKLIRQFRADQDDRRTHQGKYAQNPVERYLQQDPSPGKPADDGAGGYSDAYAAWKKQAQKPRAAAPAPADPFAGRDFGSLYDEAAAEFAAQDPDDGGY